MFMYDLSLCIFMLENLKYIINFFINLIFDRYIFYYSYGFDVIFCYYGCCDVKY